MRAHGGRRPKTARGRRPRATRGSTPEGGQRTALSRLLAPIGLVVLAALLRLPNLATRGTWDGDQGHDMLVLRALVRDGTIPLVGPPTSLGDVHHGAFYYYLLSPAAFLTGGDSPLAVVTLIALAGIAAVAVTWWLARSIGGDVAGFIAGLAMAVSISAVDESTFIWNPNVIALSSAVALAGAWRAWSTGRPRWWLVAAVGTAMTMQAHVLGVTILPIVGALLIADARSRAWAGGGVAGRRVWRFGLAALGIIALSLVPLAIHELTTDFSEVQAALAYIRAGGDPAALGPLARFVVIGARVVSWPLTGLITDAVLPAMIAVVAVIAIVLALTLGRLGSTRERQAAAWLGVGLLWTAAALTFLSPSLATVVPGLPNDHYHAFADPMVFVLVGLGAGALWRLGARGRDGRRSGRFRRFGRSSAQPTPRRWSGRHPSSACPDRRVRRGASWPDSASRSWSASTPPISRRRSIRTAASPRPRSPPPGSWPRRASRRSRFDRCPDFKSIEAYEYPLVRAGALVRADPALDGTAIDRRRRARAHLRFGVRGGHRRALRGPGRGGRSAAGPVRRPDRPVPRGPEPDDLGLSARTVRSAERARAAPPRAAAGCGVAAFWPDSCPAVLRRGYLGRLAGFST